MANDWLITTWTTVNRSPFSYSTTNLHIGGREILGLVWTFLLALFTSTRLPSTSHPFSSWMKAGMITTIRIQFTRDRWRRICVPFKTPNTSALLERQIIITNSAMPACSLWPRIYDQLLTTLRRAVEVNYVLQTGAWKCSCSNNRWCLILFCHFVTY